MKFYAIVLAVCVVSLSGCSVLTQGGDGKAPLEECRHQGDSPAVAPA
ncbi:hypothetical protein [Desulfuromonas acetoxidans]|nr:hypothetical protein [Desulfuromonas acetoxidans]